MSKLTCSDTINCSCLCSSLVRYKRHTFIATSSRNHAAPGAVSKVRIPSPFSDHSALLHGSAQGSDLELLSHSSLPTFALGVSGLCLLMRTNAVSIHHFFVVRVVPDVSEQLELSAHGVSRSGFVAVFIRSSLGSHKLRVALLEFFLYRDSEFVQRMQTVTRRGRETTNTLENVKKDEAKETLRLRPKTVPHCSCNVRTQDARTKKTCGNLSSRKGVSPHLVLGSW